MTFTPTYLATIRARTLIVHGDRDEFFPVSIPIEMYRSIPNSSLWIVPEGGHVPIFGETRAEFVRIALKFLAAKRAHRLSAPSAFRRNQGLVAKSGAS